jgi:hypothetical protein
VKVDGADAAGAEAVAKVGAVDPAAPKLKVTGAAEEVTGVVDWDADEDAPKEKLIGAGAEELVVAVVAVAGAAEEEAPKEKLIGGGAEEAGAVVDAAVP